jgi:XTP/dITP diphosphohydrolase
VALVPLERKIFIFEAGLNPAFFMELIFASSNKHKVEEIQQLLDKSYLIKGLADLNFTDEIPEDALTLEGNALLKARFVHNRWGKSCFADDTGLEVEALNGEPGVFSARYSGALADFGGSEKLRTQANKDKLLKSLEGVENRKARFRTVIAYIENNQEYLFEGIVNGTIANQELGDGGFGYDPLFIPEGFTTSFAQMSLADKNTISHRARATMQFVSWLNNRK